MENFFNSPASIWLVLGIIFILSEFFMPGLIAIFLGLGALVVSLSLYFELVSDTFYVLFLVWIFATMLLIVLFRQLLASMIPADRETGDMDEFEDPIGKSVVVSKKIFPNNNSGRIEFRGTTWSARSAEGILEKGMKVIILEKDSDVFIVKVDD